MKCASHFSLVVCVLFCCCRQSTVLSLNTKWFWFFFSFQILFFYLSSSILYTWIVLHNRLTMIFFSFFFVFEHTRFHSGSKFRTVMHFFFLDNTEKTIEECNMHINPINLLNTRNEIYSWRVFVTVMWTRERSCMRPQHIHFIACIYNFCWREFARHILTGTSIKCDNNRIN